jgi:hypothetical protein
VLDEQALVKQAEKQYSEGKYSDAAKTYGDLIAEYPSSSDKPKYDFLQNLSNLQAGISSVTTRETPGPAQVQYAEFMASHGDSPFAKPETGFGIDVVQENRGTRKSRENRRPSPRHLRQLGEVPQQGREAADRDQRTLR